MESKTEISEQEVKEVLQELVKSCKNEPAKIYANAALNLNMTGYELYIQILYVVSNIQYWRGDIAKEVRTLLNKYIKQEEKKINARR